MSKETVYLQYAHCVKFTEGQLDRDPFSQYQLREMPVVVQFVAGDEHYPQPSWRVIGQDGTCLACEDEREDALALAAYKLMDESRQIQSVKSQVRQQTK